MVSEIIKARKLLYRVLDRGELGPWSRRLVNKAIHLMFRAPPVRRAPRHRIVIDARKRRAVQRLKYTDMTQHEIASVTGLRSSGRVSEVLNGKR